MADPFVAEIRIFPFSFAPSGWAFCNGQIMPISQNTALFALLGTYYGGDGKSNFGLPNLQARAPMFYGQGSGLSLHNIGETGGTATVSLNASQLPQHSHGINCLDTPRTRGQVGNPASAIPAKTGGSPANAYTSGGAQNQTMAQGVIGPVGGNQPHNNLMPYLTLNFCIALRGIYPSRG